jgi:hypothetical protein
MRQDFEIERRQERIETTFFPERVEKRRFTWGQTRCRVIGFWTKYRPLVGNVQELHARIEAVANEYNVIRSQYEYIDRIKLFDDFVNVRPAGFEIWDYQGNAGSITREQVLIQWTDGTTFTLDRNKNFGFRGVVTRCEEPFSLEQYALEMLNRYRIRALNMGANLNELSSRDPWLAREAAEAQLRDLLVTAWEEYSTAPTVERLNTVIEIERTIMEYVCGGLEWELRLPHWEHMRRMGFPDTASVLQLWEEDKLDRLDPDQYFPWLIQLPERKTVKVSLIRKLYATTGKMRIIIVPQPRIHTLEWGTMPVSCQLLTYGTHGPIGPSIPNGDEQGSKGRDARNFEPFVSHVGGPTGSAWRGNLFASGGWDSIQEEGNLPEPTLEVATQYVQMRPDLVERIEAALMEPRPTLTWLPINQARAPTLVLSKVHTDGRAVPLFRGGRILRPIEQEQVRISGWAVDGAPGGKNGHFSQRVFGDEPKGFIRVPVEANPEREAAIQELLPYA